MTTVPENWINQDDSRLMLQAIGSAALEAADPHELVVRALALQGNAILAGGKTFELASDSRIFIVGAGKAGSKMAKGAMEVLQAQTIQGVIAVPQKPGEKISGVEFIQGGHPFPTPGSIIAGEKMRELLKQTRAQDLVIALISGGGSALLELPLQGLDLDALQKTNEILLKSGAAIEEINIVRTALSQLKGGGLLSMVQPAKCINLILSDVVGNRLEAVASGPTIHQNPQAEDALRVLDTYRIKNEIPREVLHILDVQESKGREGMGQPATNILVGSVRSAVKAAGTYAQEQGFRSIIVTTSLQGEARKAGVLVGALAKSVVCNKALGSKPICMILGGETTVKVLGSGLGGRNQELALAFALEIGGYDQIEMITLATDGVDGPTPAAGAYVLGSTIQKARGLGIDPNVALEENDSYTFFRDLGDVLVTGPTGTNVNDLVICIITPSQ